MNKIFLTFSLLFLFACQTRSIKDYPIKPVPLTSVHFADHFWSARLEINRRMTIPYDFRKCEETGRIDNFAKAGGLLKGPFGGRRYDDSDVYKVIEGASYSLSSLPDKRLEAYLDSIIALIASAQEQDGYLYTCRTIDPKNLPPNTGPERWSFLNHSHELYNVGHLYEAAVAHYLATGKKSLLNVALKNAELILKEFGPGKRYNPPGHQEIEIGLVKLYRVTGDERFLNLAKFFLDQRGHYEHRAPYDSIFTAEYVQDHLPVTKQREAVGHAVRAAYMYAAMTDIAALTGDQAYRQAVDSLWENVVNKKIYITGGIGARAHGEAFGDNYELPNRSAYNETCAAVANMLWNYRLFLLHGDAKYLDVFERTLYNGFLSGVSLNGMEFFYPNPLESIGNYHRSPWFDCSCCPTNVMRFLPSLPGYVYAHDDQSIYVNLFVTSTAEISLGNSKIRLIQQTDYPWSGKINLVVQPKKQAKFSLKIRIPGWVIRQPLPGTLYRFISSDFSKPVIWLNGNKVPLKIEKGFAVLNRNWQKGDSLQILLPMKVRRVKAHPKVLNDNGKVAIARGPIIFCAEGVDHQGHVLDLYLPQNNPLQFTFHPSLLKGIGVVQSKAFHVTTEGLKTTRLFLIPYYAWAHRGASEMAVWLVTDRNTARPFPLPHAGQNASVKASHVWRFDKPEAVNDGIWPENSSDTSIPRFTWWDHKGGKEWIEYRFPKPVYVTKCQVYWFNDRKVGGGCELPRIATLFYFGHQRWQKLATLEQTQLKADEFNAFLFEKIRTDRLRLEVNLQENFSAGILEWLVN